MTSPINELDHNGAQVILAGSKFISTANPLSWVIEQLKHLPIDEEKEIDEGIPSPIVWFKNGGQAFWKYHVQLLVNSRLCSEEARKIVNWTSTKILHPLSFCKIGQAIQHSLSYDILGGLARVVVQDNRESRH